MNPHYQIRLFCRRSHDPSQPWRLGGWPGYSQCPARQPPACRAGTPRPAHAAGSPGSQYHIPGPGRAPSTPCGRAQRMLTSLVAPEPHLWARRLGLGLPLGPLCFLLAQQSESEGRWRETVRGWKDPVSTQPRGTPRGARCPPNPLNDCPLNQDRFHLLYPSGF